MDELLLLGELTKKMVARLKKKSAKSAAEVLASKSKVHGCGRQTIQKKSRERDGEQSRPRPQKRNREEDWRRHVEEAAHKSKGKRRKVCIRSLSLYL